LKRDRRVSVPRIAKTARAAAMAAGCSVLCADSRHLTTRSGCSVLKAS
jgi:hypothetical protein